MCGHKPLPLLALLLHAACTVAQQPELSDSAITTEKGLELHIGAGLAYYPRTIGTPAHLDTRTNALGASGTVRLLWLPGHRLRMGIESGWVPVYSYAIEGPGPTGEVDLVAVPLLVVWGMPVTKRFEVFAGYGAYHLTSELNYLGTARSSTYSLGYAASAAYTLPITRSLGAALEVEWYNIAEARHTVLAARLGLVWNLYAW